MRKRLQKIKTGYFVLFKLAWPLVLANAFWNLQVTVDRIFLGQYSTEALAAAMTAVGLFWAPMALLQQTASYVTTFVAQYFGSGQLSMVGRSFWHSVYLAIIGGLLFLILIPMSPLLFHWMGHDLLLQQLETDYFSAICYSALATALLAAVSGFYSGIGKSSMVLIFNGIGVSINIVLDYLLIFGHFGFPKMGITGAGYATVIANSCAAAVGLWLIWRSGNNTHKIYHIRESFLKIDLDLAKRFLKFGIPSGMQWALEGLAFTVFLIFIGRMQDGTVVLAASSMTVTIMMLSVLPVMGIAQAVSIQVGQFLGAHRPNRAVRSTWIGVQVGLAYIAAMGLSFVVFPNFYLAWFKNENNLEVWSRIETIVPVLLLFVAIFSLFDCLNLILSFALKGAGDTRFVTAVALTLPWPIMVVPTWYFVDHPHSIYIAWIAASLFIITQAIVFLARFRQGRWQKMSVIH